ncbi:hypothetical protein HOP50_19g84160 [Chloropicon primus]|nr:hypothetical protein HOP50_19g84160 [Chloropicon primus]
MEVAAAGNQRSCIGVTDEGAMMMSSGKACANCGATANLLKCSRCHQAWFCSVSCQKQYWPFHKSVCRRNDFADALEGSEPKFASWMRKHGKIAVLKDDEVDRLERAGQACNGTTREEVMSSMYGRADPKPLPPSYTPEDLKKMKEKEEARLLESAKVATIEDKSWTSIRVDPDLGLDCGAYKWTQTQAQVLVYVKLPPQPFSRYSSFGKNSQVEVSLEPQKLRVTSKGQETIMSGTLYREIKCDESTWYVTDGILEICLLKRYRRGLAYQKGETNANTYWKSVFKEASQEETLCLRYPPSSYYDTEWKMEGGGGDHTTQGRRRVARGEPKRVTAV